jgi:membrane-bound serine protease (ClpP class)
MDFLIDPNFAYIFIVGAVLFALMTLIIPGTGLPETGMVISLGLAWYAMSNLQPSPWALGLVVLSLIPFFLALRVNQFRLFFLVLSILLLMGGSTFLFVDQNGFPAVNPFLAGGVSILSGGFIWFAVDRAVKIQSARPVNDPDAIIGRIGQTRTEILNSGSVQVGAELWSARSETPIPSGSAVRILKREGFVLIVEKVSN